MSASSASVYNGASRKVQSSAGFQLLQKLPVAVGKTWKVADIGCGTGIIAMELSKVVGENGLVLAIDPSTNRINFLKDQLTSSATKNLILLNTGAEDCNFVDYGPFDLMFSNVVMHWIEEKKLRAIYQSVMDALKPGGYFAMCVAEMTAEEGGYRKMFFTALTKEARKQLFQHVFQRPLDWYVNLAEELGFNVLEKGYIYVDGCYQSVDGLVKTLNGTFEGVLPFEDYFNEVSVKESGAYQFNSDGSFFAEVRFSFFVVQKNK